MNGVTIAQTMIVAEQRQAALPAELAGSLVLSVADAMLSLALRIGPQELVLLQDGTVRICGGVPADENTAEQSLRSLLERLLLSASSVTPALLRASRRPSRGSVAELVRELEVALIPTNRGAARRALARLCREVTQALQQFPQLQQEADSLVLLEPNPAESEKPLVVAPLPPVALPVEVAPPPAASEELEILDFLDIELSPSVPVVPSVPFVPSVPSSVQPYIARPVRPAVAAPPEIPDLVIPGVSKAELVPPPDWQPVEHTVKLNLPVRSSLASLASAPTSSNYRAPLVSAQCAAIQLEYVELTDDDVREATVELPPPLKRMPPPKPPLRSLCKPPIADPNTTSHAPQPERQNSAPDYQTAEPFLLVVPSHGHAALASPVTRAESIDVQQIADGSVPQRQASDSPESTAMAKLPSVAVVGAMAEPDLRESGSSEPAESGEQPCVVQDEASALAEIDGFDLQAELADFVVEPSERLVIRETSERVGEPPKGKLFGEPTEFMIEPSERLFFGESAADGAACALAPLAEVPASVSDDADEHVLAEVEHTVLDVTTFVGDLVAPADVIGAEFRRPEPRPVQCVPVLTLDEVQPINWRPQPIPEPHALESEYPDCDVISEGLVPIIEESIEVVERPSPVLITGPHRYSAQPTKSSKALDLKSRVAKFSVREPANPAELNIGLQRLAGLLQDSASELSVTPPPTTYTAELAERATEESKSPMARTLIGLGAVGTLFVLATFGVASRGHVAAAAANPVLNLQKATECMAIITVAEVPEGASVQVTQNGRRPTPRRIQVGQSPLRIDGLACGTPAELLVKVTERGWYRIPIEPSRLTAGESQEPVRVASFMRQ